ncbi:hypothetical protein O3Q51_17775 [Cryomorphaceae bacterium 1068]|nr:hypothetical protein [Cryomorphaceae bacterium 1068]
MIKDIFFSFRDNLREKTSNPFLATYFIVLILRNWALIFTLFNFDDDCTLDEKILIIKGYYFSKNIIQELLINVLWTFGALIVTYLLLNFSRIIVTLSEKRVKPWLYSKLDVSSIVMKETYEIVRNQRDELQVRLNQEREAKSLLESEIKVLEESNREILRAQAETINDTTDSKPSPKAQETPKTRIKNDIEIIIEKLSDNKALQAFRNTATEVRKGNTISKNSKELNLFLELGLLRHVTHDQWKEGFATFSLTPDGDKVLNELRKM